HGLHDDRLLELLDHRALDRVGLFHRCRHGRIIGLVARLRQAAWLQPDLDQRRVRAYEADTKETDMLDAPGFHHLHLNSMNPEAAIDFYVRHFPRSGKTTWGGLPALSAPNDVLVLFTSVATAPPTSPQTA